MMTAPISSNAATAAVIDTRRRVSLVFFMRAASKTSTVALDARSRKTIRENLIRET
jgi:hypothetical protein